MNKLALEAYLNNNNLQPDGVYGYYEFNTGHKNFLYNNYYSGENYVLLSVTGINIISGGGGYLDTSSINNSGDLISASGEQKNIPFKIDATNGLVVSAFIDAGNVGGNVGGNVAGNPANYTGLYYQTPSYIISNTTGTGLVLELKTVPNIESGTRYDLNPLIARGTSGMIKSAIEIDSISLGSGHFLGNGSLEFSSGFDDSNWTMFIDCKVPSEFAVGRSKVLLTSYYGWASQSGFAVTIDDSRDLNFEYRITGNQVNSYSTHLPIEENNLISISKDDASSSIIIGKHDLSENRHEFEKFQAVYTKGDHLYIGGIRSSFYLNSGYTGFSGYINEILFLNQSCNSDQLTELSNLFAITGYSPATTGSVITTFPLVTGVDSTALITTGSGNIGYELYYDADGNAYYPSGISGAINQTGILIYYDPVNSGQLEEVINIDEVFFVDSGLRTKYAPKYLSFNTEIANSDTMEIYYYSSFDSSKPSSLQPNFSATPGKLYFDTGVSDIAFNLYDNGIRQVSGVDYDYAANNSVIDSNSYNSYSNNIEDNVFISSLPESISVVSGFTFIPPGQGEEYQYPSFPFSLANDSGYLLYLNGQKLAQGVNADYSVVGGVLSLNTDYNYNSGTIDIANIRSGSPRSYINTFNTAATNFYYTTGINNTVIDEHIFLNGQRLSRDIDYVKVSSGDLRIRNAIISNQTFPFFTGETGFFNV
jgi:hypothetical protein